VDGSVNLVGKHTKALCYRYGLGQGFYAQLVHTRLAVCLDGTSPGGFGEPGDVPVYRFWSPWSATRRSSAASV